LHNGPALYEMWRLQLYAVAPMQSTIGTLPVGKIEIFARMADGYVLSNIEAEGKKTTKDQFPTSGSSSAARPGAISGVTSKLGKVAGMLSGVPVIGAFAAPVAQGLAAVSSIAELFGFTREAAPTLPQPYIGRLFSSISTVDGADTGEPCGLYASNATTIDPRPGGGEAEDAAAFTSLFERWTIVDRFLLNNLTSAQGSVARVVPVSPFFAGVTLGAFYPTVAGYVGLPFGQWNGSMEYMIYVVSGANVRGQVMVMWDPNINGSVTYATNPGHRLRNVIIELGGSSATHLRVDMSSLHPAKSTHLLGAANLGSATDASFNGQLAFYVQTPVTTVKVTSFDVTVVVLARASGNMRFGVPAATVRANAAIPVVSSVRIEGDDGLGDGLPETVMTLVKSENPDYPVKDVLWGEEFLSVRPLMQKFSATAWAVNNYRNDRRMAFPHYMPPPSSFAILWNTLAHAQTSIPFTYAGYYAPLFVGVRGSQRMKVYATASAADTVFMGVALSNQDVQDSTDTTVMDADSIPRYLVGDVQTLGTSKAVEFVFPTYSMLKYWVPRWRFTMLNGGAEFRANMVVGLSDATNPLLPAISARVYTAFGPDVTVTRFRRCPGITFFTG